MLPDKIPVKTNAEMINNFVLTNVLRDKDASLSLIELMGNFYKHQKHYYDKKEDLFTYRSLDYLSYSLKVLKASILKDVLLISEYVGVSTNAILLKSDVEINPLELLSSFADLHKMVGNATIVDFEDPLSAIVSIVVGMPFKENLDGLIQEIDSSAEYKTEWI